MTIPTTGTKSAHLYERARSVMPGGEGIEEVGENEYAGNLKIKVGPVQGKFKGKIKLSDIVEPDSYKMEVDGKGACNIEFVARWRMVNAASL